MIARYRSVKTPDGSNGMVIDPEGGYCLACDVKEKTIEKKRLLDKLEIMETLGGDLIQIKEVRELIEECIQEKPMEIDI